MTPIAVDVDGLRKLFVDGRQHVRAVEDVSFHVEPGTFFTLLGPSGCGKTTTMRCIAGLEEVDAGSIALGGSVVSSATPPVFVPPHRRNIGMVFQSYAIWPHLTAGQNVAFPLKAAGIDPASPEARARVDEALALVRLDGLASRMATQLSGGQQQRLALARALVGRPQLLLLDEPLSNLDARLRDEMRGEIRSLQQRFGITTIYVTHDQVEAMSMSDRIAVMYEGRIVQLGTPSDMYLRPANAFVADFLGNNNDLAGTVTRILSAGEVLVETAIGTFPATTREAIAAGAAVSVKGRPEHFRLARASATDRGAHVVARTFFGELTEHVVAVGDVRIRTRAFSPVDIALGEVVTIDVVAGMASVILR